MPGTAVGTGRNPAPLPFRQEMASRWWLVEGLKLHARVAVPALPSAHAPIVLVHGLGVSSRYMEPIAKVLASDYVIYAPDLPGFGRSDAPARALDIAALGDALAAWLHVAGLDRVVLLGNSAGCQVIVQLALRHSPLVEAAILVGATVDPRAPSFWKQLGRGLLDVPREPWALLPILVGDYLAAGPIRVARTLMHALHDDVRAHLPKVRVPTLVVRGARDPIVSQAWAEEMAELLPHGSLVVLPSAAHAANFDAPEELAQAVRSFLRTLGLG